MKSLYTNSVFYTNKNEVELLTKLGMYSQCFDYNGLFEFWCDWSMQEDIQNVIILPFYIYLCDKKYL